MGSCGVYGARTCLRRGAAAHPPLPLEARYNPPRAAGIRDLSGGSESRCLRARLAGLGRDRAPESRQGEEGGCESRARKRRAPRLIVPWRIQVRVVKLV